MKTKIVLNCFFFHNILLEDDKTVSCVYSIEIVYTNKANQFKNPENKVTFRTNKTQNLETVKRVTNL